MPNGMRGDELARQARRRRPELKVLLTSGYPTPDLRERQSLGEFRVLRKPYRADELMRSINERLAH
jgi:CheY-like chemotaxis protein